MRLRKIPGHGAAALICLVSPVLGAPRLFIDSRPTNLDPNDRINRLIHREIPRQALIVAATEDFGATCVDPTVEPAAQPRDGDVKIGLDRKADLDRKLFIVTLFDGQNNPLDKVEIPQKVNDEQVVALDDYAEKMDELVRTKWEGILAKQMGRTPHPPKWDASLAAPVEDDRLLSTIDFQHAFVAARATHLAIADSGESPARLGALVRAYANLGDATRHLVAGQSVGFFARSIMYAQRLVRLAPNDPASWWHRAYVETLFGNSLAAEADFQRASTLGEKSLPSWVDPTRSLLRFQTIDLYNKANDPLCAYFAWLSVEHSWLPSMTIDFGRLALERNPGAVRIMDSITANSGVGLNHQTTKQSSLILNRLVSALAKEPAAPQVIQDATKIALSKRFGVEAILDLLGTFEKQPEEPGVPLQWATFASLVRECQFINCVRRLNFVTDVWGVDPSEEREQWLVTLGDHRYVDFIRSYESLYQRATPALVEKVRHINFKDDAMGANLLIEHFERLGISEDPRLHLYWNTRQRDQASNSAYDSAQYLWLYRFATLPEQIKTRDSQAKMLLSISPNHPIATATLLLDQWQAMQPKLPQIECELSDNPNVAYALGCGYASDKQYAKATPLLEEALQYAPDKIVYQQLADIKLAQHDEDGWLAEWNKYLNTSEDFGLDHGQVNDQIAKHFMQKGEYEKALPYAKDASDNTGASWAFINYADVLAKLSKYDDAAAVLKENAERYEEPIRFYRFCRSTGHGDLATASLMYQQKIPQLLASKNPDMLSDVGVFYYLEKKPAAAARCFLAARTIISTKSSRFYLLLPAMLAVEQNHPDEAKKLLDSAADWPIFSPREKAYASCVAELSRCLNDPNALPARDGEIGKIIADNDLAMQRGNICCIFGWLCELRHHNEDAKWWYRQSLGTNVDYFCCQPISAVALRRLGDDYYK